MILVRTTKAIGGKPTGALLQVTPKTAELLISQGEAVRVTK